MEQHLAWKAPEHHYVKKGSTWYLLSGIIASIAAIIAIWQGNMMFFVFIVIAEIAVLFLVGAEPKIVNYSIFDQGIGILPEDKKHSADQEAIFYPFTSLDSFAIHHNPLSNQYSEIILRKKEKLSTYVTIMIADQTVATAEDILGYYLDEFEYEESLTDHLLKIIGL